MRPLEHRRATSEVRTLKFLTSGTRLGLYEIVSAIGAAEKLRPWTDYRTFAAPARYNVSLAPGNRFVVVGPSATTTEEPAADHVTFLLNFFDEIRRRAPSR